MCDTIIKEKLPKEEIPQYVYKRVQKVGKGKYVTPVMGEPLYKGSWKGAKSYKKPEIEGLWTGGLIYSLNTKFQKAAWVNSSEWVKHHVSKWASFRSFRDACSADLVSNFSQSGYCSDRYPTLVVKCEIRGDVDKGNYKGMDTYLSSQIRVVEEIKDLTTR